MLCIDRPTARSSGSKVVLTAKLEGKHRLNSFASATPAPTANTSGSRSSTIPTCRSVCYDFDGNEIWRKSPGKLLSVHGFCTSPILYKDLVILNGDQDAQAYIVALDKNTGAETWRADRPNRTRSYCTPILIDPPSIPA